MASPKNLTGQITRLRERKGGFLPESSVADEPERPSPALPAAPAAHGRRIANDTFMWFSYALFAAAMVTQLALVLWMDLF
ncbi:MAG: hypothetical protein GWO81_02155 [Verrucomicrobia bacterium]|nr:hypothetical protein [Verrucomicrobiota bacterium]